MLIDLVSAERKVILYSSFAMTIEVSVIFG